MVSKTNKIRRVTYIIENNLLDVDDLTIMFEITVEDLIERFQDRMIEHYEKFEPDGYVVELDDAESEEKREDEEDQVY